MYDKNNIFAKILRKEIPCEVIFEDEQVLAFHDINPAAPIHIIVIPKGEYVSFDDFSQKASDKKISHFFKAVQKIADNLDVVESGYRVIMNHGQNASQTVFHFHVHILSGRPLGGLIPSDTHNR